MVVDDPLEYRPNSGEYVTVALWDDEDVENPTYLVIEMDYEEVKEQSPELARARKRYITRKQLRPYLKSLIGGFKTYNFELIITFIQNYGGINIRPSNGAWKGFVPLYETY